MNTLSQAKAPLMTTWPALGERSVTFGASVVMPWMVRGVASASISSLRMLALTLGDAIAEGVSADLDRLGQGAGRQCHVLRDLQADVHGRRFLTVVKPANSKVTSCWPAGSAASV